MYGTLGRMKPKLGKRDELVAMMSAPPAGAAANGYRGAYLLKADDGDEVVVAVMYDDKDSYVAMVHDPQTDENFGKIMALLKDEPTWTDGDRLLVASFTPVAHPHNEGEGRAQLKRERM